LSHAGTSGCTASEKIDGFAFEGRCSLDMMRVMDPSFVRSLRNRDRTGCRSRPARRGRKRERQAGEGLQAGTAGRGWRINGAGVEGGTGA
jgi:hypothetical protein